MARVQIMLTCAPSGAGKSYRRCAWYLVKDFLPYGKGVHCSNFPVNIEALAEYMERTAKISPEETRKRVRVIPQDVVDSWARGSSGPWDYFAGVDLKGWHIAIDEAHNFCGTNVGKEVVKRWQEWVGELRHCGATVEFLTQHEDKLHKAIKDEAVILNALVKSDERPDPLFKIPMADWYELYAAFTGKYDSSCWQVEYRRVRKGWSETRATKFRFLKEFFGLYDSFSAPVKGEALKADSPDHVYLKLSPPGVLRWFVVRNFGTLFPRVAIVVALV